MEHRGRNDGGYSVPMVPIAGAQFAGSFVPALRLLESRAHRSWSRSPWVLVRLYLTEEWKAVDVWKSAVRFLRSLIRNYRDYSKISNDAEGILDSLSNR
jgi:hypothetical protein